MDKTKLKGTLTEQSLINSFAGESQARNRYTYFSKIAQNEGFEQISAIFTETANNEKEHAKIFYKHLCNGEFKVNAFYPFFMGNTYENLGNAASGEKQEWSILYYNGAMTAQEEGFDDIADDFWRISEVEKHHESRYLELAMNLKESSTFKKQQEESWICRNCGFINRSFEAPKICPLCKFPKGYFELLCEKF